MAAASAGDKEPEEARAEEADAVETEQAGFSAQPEGSNMNLSAATVPAPAQPEATSPVVPRPPVAPGQASMLSAHGGAVTSEVRQVNPTFYKNLAELRQNFQQRTVEATSRQQKRNLPTSVLANFQIERQGQKVRILDQDGSVYTGQVINEESYAAADSASDDGGVALGVQAAQNAPISPNAVPANGSDQSEKTSQSAKALAATLPVGQFYFRARGTNNTLRQVVVIEATLDHQLTGKALSRKGPNTAAVGLQGVPNNMVPPRRTTQTKPSAGFNMEMAEKKMAEQTEKPMTNQEGQSRQAVRSLRVLGNARIGKENFPLNAYQDSAAKVPTAKERRNGTRK